MKLYKAIVRKVKKDELVVNDKGHEDNFCMSDTIGDWVFLTDFIDPQTKKPCENWYKSLNGFNYHVSWLEFLQELPDDWYPT